MDWRSSEFQALLDIQPTKVVEKEEPKEVKEDQTEEDKYEFTDANNILRYFHLPHPRNVQPDILQDIYDIGKKLQDSTRSNDEFFDFLKVIETRLPEYDSSADRVKAVKRYIKTAGTALRQYIIENRILNKDILADEAKDSGNWRKYLRYTQERAKEARR